MLKEKPRSAAAVIKILIKVVLPEPSFKVIRSLIRLEIIVPMEMMGEIIPAKETGTFISSNIEGHAEPRTVSGKPRPIKARYSTATSRINIIPPYRI